MRTRRTAKTMAKRMANTAANTLLLSMIVILLSLMASAQIQPTAPDLISYSGNQSPEATPGMALTTSGGTITTIDINATSQNPHWKAYVGNISGELALQDASGNSVFDWQVISMEGEVYASRKSTVVDWNSIVCAGTGEIQAEETALNMTSSQEDSIASTFNETQHALFYAGLTEVSANSCNSTNLYVNSEASDDFEELLLYDGEYIVYTALIEDSMTGFDGNQYDFQMILPESGLEGDQSPETYYFYVELI